MKFYYKLWIITSAIMVVIILAIGGFTRLTNSGLSIVEWKPITGILPPLTEQNWIKEKTKYESSPEYKHINFDITLDQFKKIYLIEYTHRLIARLAGIIFIFPFIYFVIINKFKIYSKVYGQSFELFKSIKVSYKLYFVFFLGLLQGFFGWYMVSSGLNIDPHVSHYRLALHFVTALIIFSLLWYEFYEPKNYFKNNFALVIITTIISFTFIQAIFGAFVAGLKGGMIYNSFPLMEGRIIPNDVFVFNKSILELFSNIKFVQFIHRINGIIILFLSLVLLIYSYFKMKHILKNILILTLLILIQILLGAATLLYHVPVLLSMIHQFCIIIILTSSLMLYKKLS